MALWMRHKASVLAIGLVVPLVTMDIVSILIGLLLIIVKITIDETKFCKFEQLISEIVSLTIFLVIILILDDELHFDGWSALGLVIVPLNSIISFKFMPIINKNYIRTEGALSFIRGSMILLLPLSLH